MPGETGLGSSERADLNVLELELRKLPAVVAVGFEGPSAGAPVAEDAILTVQLLVNDHDAGPTVEQQALDLARLHLGRPLQVVITPESPETAWVTAAAEPPTRNRVRIVDVNLVDNGRAVEVTLDQAQRQAVARGAPARPWRPRGRRSGRSANWAGWCRSTWPPPCASPWAAWARCSSTSSLPRVTGWEPAQRRPRSGPP